MHDVGGFSGIAVKSCCICYLGLLSPVKDLTVTVLNGSSVLLMWSAPYTLDNVPITGYNINDDQGTIIDTVNTTEYILTSNNDDPCNVTTVYVSGINGAGIGDSNSVMYYIARGNILCVYAWVLYFYYIYFSSSSDSSISYTKSKWT